MLTSTQSVGVAPEVNLRITQARKHARDPPWILNPGQTLPEVQNGGRHCPTKRTYVLKIFFQNKVTHDTIYYYAKSVPGVKHFYWVQSYCLPYRGTIWCQIEMAEVLGSMFT